MFVTAHRRARRVLTALALAGTLAGGVLAGSAVLAAPAGASATTPGPGMGCGAGSDSCAGWVASYNNPTCVAYNVTWTHNFYGAPGGWAYWHVVVDQWWNGGANCTAGGGAHLIGRAGDYYWADYITPHIRISSGGQGVLEALPHHESTLYGGFGTGGTIAWTPCIGASGDSDSNNIIDSHGQTQLAFQVGQFSTDIWGQNTTTATYCDYRPGVTNNDSHNGAIVAWGFFCKNYATTCANQVSFILW